MLREQVEASAGRNGERWEVWGDGQVLHLPVKTWTFLSGNREAPESSE